MNNSLQAQSKNTLQEIGSWREQFLQRTLIISAAVGLFALIPSVYSTPDFILQSIYIGSYVLLVTAILIDLPYIFKASLFVSLPLILGIGSITETGIRGDSLFFFLAFATFSSLLIGPRAGIASIFISEIIIIGVGYLILNDIYTLSDRLTFEGNLADWISAAFSLFIVALVTMSGIRMLNERIRQTQLRVESMNDSLLAMQTELDNRISERTKELTRKTDQLNSAYLVAHQTAAIQQLDTLLNKTVTLISNKFNLYHVGLYLMNQRGDYVNLQAASSDGGKRLIDRGYRLRVGTEGIIGFVAAEKKPRISLDVGKDAIFFDNPELPETRSEISLPLISRNKVIGVLDLQSADDSAFRYDEIEIFQTMADQIAVTIDNVQVITESQLVISQLETLSSENTRQNWKTELTAHKPIFHYSATGVRPIDSPAPKSKKNVLAIPITLRGQNIGKISLERKAEFHKWTAQEEIVATEVAAQTALALENIRLAERAKQRANREQAISNITSRVRETLDLDTVLRTSAREIQKTLNLQEAEIRLISQDNPDEEKNPSKVTS
jgi:GAF domain-containing protein